MICSFPPPRFMRAPAETEEKTKQNKASSRVSDAVLCCAVAGQVVSGKKERKITILYFFSSANIEPGWNRDVRACVSKFVHAHLEVELCQSSPVRLISSSLCTSPPPNPPNPLLGPLDRQTGSTLLAWTGCSADGTAKVTSWVRVLFERDGWVR